MTRCPLPYKQQLGQWVERFCSPFAVVLSEMERKTVPNAFGTERELSERKTALPTAVFRFIDSEDMSQTERTGDE